MRTAGTQRHLHHQDRSLTNGHQVNGRYQLRRDAIRDQAGDAFFLSQGVSHTNDRAVVVHANDQAASCGVCERDNRAQGLHR